MTTASSIGKGVFKGAVIISIFAALGKMMGFVQKVVMAHFFGTGMEADAYTLAYSSIVFAFCMIPQQLLAPFLPLFTDKKEKDGEDSAWRFVGSVATLVAVAMFITVAAGMLLAPQLVSVMSSFKSADTKNLASVLVRIMMPAAFFMGIFSLLALVLNAHKRFAFPAMGDTLNKVCAVVVLILLYKAFGVRGLAVGIVGGALAAVVLQVFGLRSRIMSLQFSVDWKDPALRRLGILIPPVLLSILVAQLRTIVDYKFASGMAQGCVASLNYARGITDTLVLLGPSAIGVAIYPFFSDMTAAENREKLTDALMRALRMMAFIFIPLTVAIILLRTPFVQLAFQRGKFEMDSVALTVAPLTYYSLGLTAFALEIILMRFYFSMKNTLTPAVVGIICVGIHIAVVLLLKGSMQHSSMALAASISKTAKVAIMFVLLGSVLPSLQWKQNGVFMAKALFAAACMGLAVYFTHDMTDKVLVAFSQSSKTIRTIFLAIQLGTCSLAGVMVFSTLTLALKMEEASTIWAWIKTRGRSAI